MALRFTDDLIQNTGGSSDFVVRERKPRLSLIALAFAFALCVLYFAGSLFNELGSHIAFFLLLMVILGALAWFTLHLISRHRDITLATEFQNAMLASATQLATRFCLITKRDGSIVYIDPGFQSFFPHFASSGQNRTIDGLLTTANVPPDIARKVIALLQNNQNGRLVLPFQDAGGSSVPIMVTMDILPRPKGYFLFRGRDYVENRRTPAPKPEQDANLLSQALSALADGMLVTDMNGVIVYANRTMESWLDYGPGELVASYPTIAAVVPHYAGLEPGLVPPGAYEGEAVVISRGGVKLRVHLSQSVLQENGKITGLALLARAVQEEKKNPDIAVTETTLHLSQFIASSPLAIAWLTQDGTVREYNRSLHDLVKTPLPEAGWSFLDLLHDDNRGDVTLRLERIGASAVTDEADKKPLEVALGKEGRITASLYLSRIPNERKEIFAQLIDTTEQRNLEQRFAHSQKMQAVGQLAGGVAHDFNNLLTAMIGFCDLLLMRHPAGDQSFADIMQVKQNANRAANLVRQLLAFSRRQTLQPKMLDITDVLAELSNLVRRLIGENIELKVIHGRDLGMVKADQGQLEQVFINLAVNARDAMLSGGRLTIRTSHVRIDRQNPVGLNLVPPVEDEAIVDGDYVLVEVIDTGTGIPRELLQKIFEPFFSTKEVGSGTGLGLATVYGIIKQTGGYIYVTSRENEGTIFSLFFKRYQPEETKPVPETAERPLSDDLTGKGTVLLVEDETPVRTFAARALRNKGYTVLEADCGETAIEVMEKQGSEVDVIITDVIMPGINGPDMIEAVAPKFPRVKVVFISGYAEDIFVKSYGSEREFNFLPKPFTLKQLASKVKEVIQG